MKFTFIFISKLKFKLETESTKLKTGLKLNFFGLKKPKKPTKKKQKQNPGQLNFL